jgi:hypothetical protein
MGCGHKQTPSVVSRPASAGTVRKGHGSIIAAGRGNQRLERDVSTQPKRTDGWGRSAGHEHSTLQRRRGPIAPSTGGHPFAGGGLPITSPQNAGSHYGSPTPATQPARREPRPPHAAGENCRGRENNCNAGVSGCVLSWEYHGSLKLRIFSRRRDRKSRS